MVELLFFNHIFTLFIVSVTRNSAETDKRKTPYSVCICFCWILSHADLVHFCRSNSRCFPFYKCFIYILHYPWLDSCISCILCSCHIWRTMWAFLSQQLSLASLTHLTGGFLSCRYCCELLLFSHCTFVPYISSVLYSVFSPYLTYKPRIRKLKYTFLNDT